MKIMKVYCMADAFIVSCRPADCSQDWVVSAIDKAVEAASPPSQGARSSGPPTSATTCASPNPLALPAGLGARITNELKIHHNHLSSCWEAAVYVQPKLKGHPAALAALQELVRRRIRDAHAQTVDQNTEGKKIVDVSEGEA